MSTFTLKMLALIFMFIDHIGLYFDGAPAILGMIGRLSYPLFLFCLVWGYHYTKSRVKFLIRLYAMSVFMSFFMMGVERYFPTDEFGYGYQNIFLPMFVVCVLISTIELYQKDPKKGGLALGAIFAVQFVFYLLPGFFPVLKSNFDILTGFIPNIAHNEYGFSFVALGVLMYFLKERKELFCAMYIIFCIAQFSQELVDYGNASQFLMIGALPFMMKYNNQKGYGFKYFFYVFYPVHTFILFYLAHFVIL